MTNFIKTLFISTVLTALPWYSSIGQATSTSHFGGTGDWLGWDALTTIDLEIRHENDRDINFFTGLTNARRMTIKGFNNMGWGPPPSGMITGLDNTGFVGIGTVDQPMAYPRSRRLPVGE